MDYQMASDSPQEKKEDSPLSGLIVALRLNDTAKTTRNAAGFDRWFDSYTTFTDMLLTFRDIGYYQRQRNVLDNSIVFGRFVELHKNLPWVFICVLSGNYHSAIRELRYILDSFLQAYYLDQEHPTAGVPCKLEVLREIERKRFGSRLIERIGVQEKGEMKELYKELSQFVHASYEEMKTVLDERTIFDRVTYDFVQTSFDRCIDLTARVLDVVFLLTLTRFPELISQLTPDLKRAISDDYRLTLRYMESHTVAPT